jgi:hypothetical protein
VQRRSSPTAAFTTNLALSRLIGWIAPVVIVLIGLAIRVYRYDELSLWLDEIYVVEYLKLPWRDLLGLNGTYDNHPPLYFLLVKLVSLVTSDINAARILSIITGTATIAAVYALTLQLANRSAAIVAGLIIAISPLHVWYSQEGRMYAPTALAVTLSYYALVRMLAEQNRRWAAIYAVSLVVAAYMDYSAFYALIPQAGVVGYVVWKQGWKAARLWAGAGVAAALCFLPWVVRLVDSISFVGDDRQFLEVTRSKIVDSFFTIVGLPGSENYYWGVVQTPWVRWPEIRPTSAALVVAMLVFSAVTLNGKYRLTFVVGASILLGTIGSAAILSYAISPGYADRTVIYAVIGWAILVGATPFGRVPNGGQRMSLGATGALLTLSLLAVWSIREDGTKEQYRDLALQTQQAAMFDIPVLSDQRPVDPLIADSTGLITTALAAYGDELTTSSLSRAGDVPLFWHVYTDFPWEVEGHDRAQERFERLGYARVASQWFAPVHFLDLYVMHGTAIGHALDVPPIAFGQEDEPLPRWTLMEDSTLLNQDRVLTVYGTTGAEHAAQLEIDASPEHLYVVSIENRFSVPIGSATVILTCLDGTTELPGASHVDRAALDLDDEAWYASSVAIVCPAETTSLEVALQANGATEAQFRKLRIYELAQGEPVDDLIRPVSLPGQPGWDRTP